MNESLYLIDITVEQFRKLPPVLQEAVGAAVLRQYAQLGPNLLALIERKRRKAFEDLVNVCQGGVR